MAVQKSTRPIANSSHPQQKKQLRSLEKTESNYKENKKDLRRDKTSLLPESSRESLPHVVFDVVNHLVSKEDTKPISAQETIPYLEMYRDGICQVDATHFNKCIVFNDINYMLAHNDDKSDIFADYCSWLNYYDHSISVQETFVNELVDIAEESASIDIAEQDDEYNDIRIEYKNMLKDQMTKGNNGLVRKKYITFGIECKTLSEAKGKLSKIESDVINNFKLMSVVSYPLNGTERLKILHDIMNNPKDKFNFSYDDRGKYHTCTQDYIVPPSFDFSQKNMFKIGQKFAQCQQFIILAPELEDRVLADFLNMDCELIVNMHIQSIEQQKAIKMIKQKLTDLQAMTIEENKKALKAGYDMDIQSPELKAGREASEKILGDLQSRNERWFMVTIIVMNMNRKKSKLETECFQAQGIAQQANCTLKPYDYEQENCFVASLPLGINNLYPKRGLTTSAVAVFIPFTTQELFQGGNSLYYGLNSLSNNMIMVDRKKLKNPNGLILGVPGAGKSFSAKREMTNVFMVTNDDIVVCDPEGEYSPLIAALHGQEINISPLSHDYVNPLDINMDYADDESPITLKADFVMSMMELICASKFGLKPVEKSVIDRCVRKIYEPYLSDPTPETMPIMEDLWNALKRESDTTPEAKNLADALELYVEGSLKVFNHRTNVNIHNRFVSYNIKELGKNLKKLGMLIVQDQVWNKVSLNRNMHKSTWYYIDEFHLLLKDEQTASYSVEIWKRFRKWGGVPTGITQNVKDFLKSAEVENIFENSNFVYLLSQAPGDMEFLAKKLNISKLQISYVTNSPPGEGLIIYDGVILPFKDHFPSDTKLYSVMTTRPEDLNKNKEDKEAKGA